MTTREILHIAAGEPACSVTAHWLNLQGLAATTTSSTGSNNSGAFCDPDLLTTSYSLGRHENVSVPRALLFDHAPSRTKRRKRNNNHAETTKTTTTNTSSPRIQSVGRINSVNLESLSLQQQLQQQQDVDPFAQFSQMASSLSQSSYSRYRRNSNAFSEGRNRGHSSSSSYQVASNGRHVDWDEEEEEEGEEEEDVDVDEDERDRRAQHQKLHWQQSTFQPQQAQLDDFWQAYFQPEILDTKETNNDPTNASDAASCQFHPSSLDDLSWRNFFMPPYNPKSCLLLPPSLRLEQQDGGSSWLGVDDDMEDDAVLVAGGDGTVIRPWNNATTNASSSTTTTTTSYYEALTASQATHSVLASWKQDELEERLRCMLEDCDSCQGIILATSSQSLISSSSSLSDYQEGLFAGLSTHVLQYMADECSSARRWVLPISSSSSSSSSPILNSSQNRANSAENDGSSSAALPSWRTRHVLNVRRQVEMGLALHNHVELSHAVLPLELPSTMSGLRSSPFVASAYVAAALETATLPYRLNSHNNIEKSIVALNSYYYGSFAHAGTISFGTASNLSFADFLTTLKPSAKHSIFELDALLPMSSSTLTGADADTKAPYLSADTWLRLREGTSVERDPRMRPQGSNSQSSNSNLPGAWLLHPSSGGLLSSLSPTCSDNKNIKDASCRSRHNHFALSTAIRPLPHSSSLSSVSTAQYATCLMEGMGIRYRPEQYMACVLDQSFGGLVRDGYAAGSYWKYVFRNDNKKNSDTHLPVMLSALGNTSRIYPYLHGTSDNMMQSLSPKFRGYYNRDVMTGLLPEADDCQEALSFCMDLRDVYRPPEGSGLVANDDEDDGGFYDDDA